MRMMGGVVAVLLLSSLAHAEVLCVRFKKDGTLTGAIKVRNECKRREVQVDGPMLGLCCDGSTTTSTSTTTTVDTGFTTLTTTAPTLTTTTTLPAATTSTLPAGTTSTSIPGATTSTIVTTTIVTSSTIATTTSITSTTSTSTSSSSSTSTSTVTTTSLNCPTITTTTIIVNNCGGNPPFCNGFCADGSSCYAAGGIECSCGGPPLPCGMRPNGTCGGTCPGGQTCGQTVILGMDGCPQSYGCACLTP